MTNGVDGLLENDKYGNLVSSMAKVMDCIKDGLTYAINFLGCQMVHIRREEYAEVKAQDFVTGFETCCR